MLRCITIHLKQGIEYKKEIQEFKRLFYEFKGEIK